MHDLLLVLVGIVVGIMNAVAGGGMLIGFPVLVLLGVPPLVANASSNIITIPGQLTSAYGYRKYLKRAPRRLAFLLIPLIFGAIIGAWLLRQTTAAHFAQIVPGLVLFGIILFTVQPLIHFHLRQHLHGRKRWILHLVVMALALIPMGLYAGYFGTGFGFLMLAFLSLTHLPDTHTMNGLKNIAAACTSFASLLCLANSGLINWRVGLICSAGCALGGWLGSHYSQKFPSHWLRGIVVITGLCAVVYLALHRY